MKKPIKLFVSMLIITILSFVCVFSANAESTELTFFAVNDASAVSYDELGSVRWYQSSDGTYYLFLPADADRTALTVWFNAGAEVTCGEAKLENGKITDIFSEGDSFVLSCGDESYELNVLQGANEGSIYINTKSGNMAAVHADKSHKESGKIMITDESGNVYYDGELDYIKGRGNSTWNADKKPYNIKLDSKADLFGMGKNKSWCLLANASEVSMIRNQLAYDYAYNIGIDTTSPTRQINLYLNGEYAGLYMITEKVDIGENRIDIYDLEGKTEELNSKDLDEYPLGGFQNSQMRGTIKYSAIPNNPDDITGGYLLELEKIYRYTDEVSGFVTDNGQAVVVKTPEYASKEQVQYISSYYQAFEDALYSPTGYNSEGKHYSYYIDTEALAKMYIILEFTANFDGCSSSFFLWKDIGGKLTAGPAWDFDLSLGKGLSNNLINHISNTAEPNLLYAQTCFIGNHAENKKSLLAQAFTHNDFQELVEKIWAEEFSAYYPVFYGNIAFFGNEIKQSFIMNAIRWKTVGTYDINRISQRQSAEIKAIADYAAARYAFLSNAYKPETYFVKYDIGNYGDNLVHDTKIYNSGDKAIVLASPETDNENADFIGWSDKPDGSGRLYQPGDEIIVNDNLTLYGQWEDVNFFNRILRAVVDFFNSIAEFFKRLFSI
ncbi:MAG: CotH kinase family protein [Clostridia bacterium]|nr:CotH kinase family protein [Clostridia bacterium]